MGGPGHHLIRLHFPLECAGLHHGLDIVRFTLVGRIGLHCSRSFLDLATHFGLLRCKPASGLSSGAGSFVLVLAQVGDILSYIKSTLSLENRFS